MSYQPPPTPADRRRWWLVLMVVIMAVGLCGAITFYTLTVFDARTNARPTAPALQLPTVTATQGSADAGGRPINTPAPTATVPSTPEPVNASAIEAFRLETPPVFDGYVDEWRSQRAIAVPHITEQLPSWDGSLDVTALYWLGWDDANLYVAVEVRDNVHVQTQVAQFAYLGDSLELQFDTDVAADYAPSVNGDDFQYVITPGNFLADLPPDAFRFQGNADGAMVDAPGSGARVQSRRQADGYTLEAIIPWSDLGIIPREGLVLGVALSVNDNDSPDSAEQQLMLSHVATRRWLDPTSWGTLTLTR